MENWALELLKGICNFVFKLLELVVHTFTR